MNILLVNPNIPQKFKYLEYCDEDAKIAANKRVLVGPPLALNILAGMLPNENIIIIDQRAEMDLNPAYNCMEELAKEIKNFKPDIVSFTCLTAQYNTVVKLLELVKQIDSNILTTVGGIHPSSCPKDFIGTKADIISIGLGKHSYNEIVKEFKNNRGKPDFSKIPGIAINNGERLNFTKSLCEFSFNEFKKDYLMDDVLPNRALTDKYNYFIPRANKTIHYISTSQGCTNKCNFCYLWQMTNGHYYHRDVESIIGELKQMEQYQMIRLCDANTFGDIKKAKQLFTRIIEEGLDYHDYMADIRTDTVVKYPEVVELAAKAGMKITVCGLEATSDEELEKYDKENSVENIKEALKILNESGVRVNGNYIINPEYDEKDFERVGRFIEDNPIFNSGLTVLTPFPGTEQWEELKDKIVIKDYDYYNLSNAVIKTKLQEDVFYNKIAQLLKVSLKSGRKYIELYGQNGNI